MANRAQVNMLKFLLKYGVGNWCTFAKDRQTVDTVCSLVNLKILTTNEHGQMRLMYEENANRFMNNYKE